MRNNSRIIHRIMLLVHLQAAVLQAAVIAGGVLLSAVINLSVMINRGHMQREGFNR